MSWRARAARSRITVEPRPETRSYTSYRPYCRAVFTVLDVNQSRPGSCRVSTSMDIDIANDSGFLRAIATGRFSIAEAERTFLEVIDAITSHNARKVLFDGRQITGKPEVMERFYYSEFVAQAVTDCVYRAKLSFSPVFAYVLRPPVLDPDRFGENVAVNRGMVVKTFDNTEDATAWLQSKT